MPKFLIDKLKREYPNNPSAVYGTLNNLGAMKGNKETPKGAAMERKHEADARRTQPRERGVQTRASTRSPHIDNGHSRVRNKARHVEKLRHV